MSDPSSKERFTDLLNRLLDDDLNEDEIRELTHMVKSEPEFSTELQAQLWMDSQLSQYENSNRSERVFVQLMEETLKAEEDGKDFVQQVLHMSEASEPKPPKASKVLWATAITSLAACLVVAFFWISQTPDQPQDTTEQASQEEIMDQGVAVVSKLLGELLHQENPREEGDTVGPGILQLDSGYLALEFYRGARVTIAGPAKLELIDAERIMCHYGKIRAQVPEVAIGFTILTPKSEVIDLGTEFGVEVSPSGQTEIHVFDGKVEALSKGKTPTSKKLLTSGQAMKIKQQGDWEEITAQTERFNDLTQLPQLEQEALNKRFAAWKRNQAAAKQDKRLIAYYDFEQDPSRTRILPNRALTGKELNGAIVGAQWSQGPWPGKQALNFKRPGDRIRIHLPGSYEAITLAAWVRIDGIDRTHSSLLLTDHFDPGEIHWQFRKEGHLILGMRHSETSKNNYISKGFIDLTRLGRWFHLTTVINPKTQYVSHYLNGTLLTSRKMKETQPIQFGHASIGNWNRPVEKSRSEIRNLNGRMAELMIFKEALNEDEIRRLALK